MKTLNKCKIGTSLILALVLILQLCIIGIAQAGGEIWYCDDCNRNNDSDYCPICGKERPAQVVEYVSDSWVCPTCGKVLPIEYNFCPDDQTEKIISHGPWPARSLNGISMALVPSGQVKRQAYYGPGREYAQGGSFYTSSITDATFVSQENDFILVDMRYSLSGKRCVYFQSSCFADPPDEEEVLEGYSAVTTSKAQLYQGPGKDYDPLMKITARPNPKKQDDTEVSTDDTDDNPTEPKSTQQNNNNEKTDTDTKKSNPADNNNEKEIKDVSNGDKKKTDASEKNTKDNTTQNKTDGKADSKESKDNKKEKNIEGEGNTKKEEVTYTRTSNKIYLEPGTEIKVFFEVKDWVFAEVNTRSLLFRAWLPVSKVQATGK